MKNIIYLLAVLSMVLGSGLKAQAQYAQGERFAEVGTNFGFTRNTQEGEKLYGGYGHTVNVSLGKFKTVNKAVGWSVGNSYYSVNFPTTPPLKQPQQSNLSFTVGRFWQFYRPIGSNGKWALYGGPMVNAEFRNRVYRQFVSTTDSKTERAQMYSLGAGVSAGVLWRLSDRWGVDGNIAYATPVQLSYERTNETYTGTQPEVQRAAFNYSFRPSLNAGSIGLGFRYFY